MDCNYRDTYLPYASIRSLPSILSNGQNDTARLPLTVVTKREMLKWDTRVASPRPSIRVIRVEERGRIFVRW
jgi:hypothetical protein